MKRLSANKAIGIGFFTLSNIFFTQERLILLWANKAIGIGFFTLSNIFFTQERRILLWACS
ncbi:hypothetical protein GIB67_002511 [Kingdonia uniflora]|uniref:Uncharacterized protein n=1 Tax=Kingdonia uniflora TaxID=39325 RepID=A0A7J7N8Q0_9MAGN|nr:hypothetical protein GIB67_002511 [Kingdonia uniflora]